MSTLFGLSKNPEKYEQRALTYEQKGKTQKALKNREKAASLRAKGLGGANHGAPMGTSVATGGVPMGTGLPMGTSVATGGLPMGSSTTTTTTTTRNLAFYETKAQKWEQRNNWNKAQKNREKAWRFQNPQYATTQAPQFYQSNKFVGYNVPVTSLNKIGATHTTTAATVVETHVRPVIVEQTVRTEKITEVQPIIHREIDAPQVKIIEKHMYESVASQGSHTVTNQAIVEETIKPRIIEEIQPVVHRNVAQTVVEKVQQHSTEHIVAPTTTTKEVIQDRNVHTVGVAAGGPIGVGAGMGMGQQQTVQTTTTTGPGINQTQTTTAGPGGVHTHTGLAAKAETALAGQHNASHVNQVNRGL